MKRTKLRKTAFIVLAFCVLAAVCFFRFRDKHTFTLADEPAPHQDLKSEEIQPVFGYVKVWSAQDTDVKFTDAQDPDRVFYIGYVTPGMPAVIRLEAGRWYKVEAQGKITVRIVNLRIE